MPNFPEHEDHDDRDARRTLSALAPWAVSILAHAALVLIAVLWVWATLTQKLEQEEPIIPIATLSERPGPQTTVRTTSLPSSASPQKRALEKTEQAVQKITSTPVKADQFLIGTIAAGESKASPFGDLGSGDSGLGKGMFRDIGGNARKIVYVIDASGSLLDTLPFVLVELKHSIRKLSPKQSFQVIFITEGGIRELPPAQLKPASDEAVAAAMKWLDDGQIVPGGLAGRGPVEAMRRALSYQPDLVFLLSDNITGQGRYEIVQTELLAAIRAANKGKTKINTIQFLHPDPLARYGGKGTLQLISEEWKGIYRWIGGRELGLQ